MKKWHLIGFFVCLSISPVAYAADTLIKDSLQTVLEQTSQRDKRIDLLLNILDLSDSTPDEIPTALQLYAEAKQAGDPLGIATSLSSITLNFIDKSEKQDSLSLLLQEAKHILKGTPEEGTAHYYEMILQARLLQTASREKRAAVCDTILKQLNKRKVSENSYEKVERLFLTGIIRYLLMALTENVDYNDPLPYWEKAWKLANDFPPMARKNFTGNLYIMLSVSYRATQNSKRLMEVSNEYLQRLDEYFAEEEITRRRPYYYKGNLYILCYQQLMLNHTLIGRKKAHEYYLRYCDYIRQGKGDALGRNKLFFYDLSRAYFSSIGEKEKALAFCDSLIQLVESKNALNVASVTHYKEKADLLVTMNRPDEACEIYERAFVLADSLTRKEQLAKLGEMQVQNEVSQLELEKAQLTKRTRNIAFYAILCLVVIASGAAAYFGIHLKHIRKLQKELLRQTSKAQETERMQSAFINSICHEIRMPLDYITLDTQRITKDELTTEEKTACVDRIHQNCQSLTSSLDDILETAYHESIEGEKDAYTN